MSACGADKEQKIIRFTLAILTPWMGACHFLPAEVIAFTLLHVVVLLRNFSPMSNSNKNFSSYKNKVRATIGSTVEPF